MILQYFVPGCLGLLIVSRFTNLKIKDLNFAVLSIVYSYASYVCIGAIHEDLLEKPVIMSAVSIIVCLIVAIILVAIFNSKFVQDCLVRLFHTNLNTTIWDDVIDYKEGTNLKVYLKGKDYYFIGAYRYHEENTGDPYFAISGYSKIDRKSGDTDVMIDHDGEHNRYMVFKFSDVEYIEVF